MIVLAGADLILPDRVIAGGSLIVVDGRITAIEPRVIDPPAGAARIDVADCVIAPGFVDVHVHGVEGTDVLDGPGAVAEVARRLPRYGVTAFCPTSMACAPPELDGLLGEVAGLAAGARPDGARVLGAHLESNFINPEYAGAQPLPCLRWPPDARHLGRRWPDGYLSPPGGDFAPSAPDFDASDILAVMARHRPALGIVTLAPELDGGLELARALGTTGCRVSIGHTGASYDQTLAAIDAGVTHATHLFNRMSPMTHRAPGVVGAVLQSRQVVAELICDAFHVHPAMMRLAMRLKGQGGLMAITDGTAGSGLAAGVRTRLGGRPIVVTDRAATLEDGTLAGSVLTMDGAFRILVRQAGASLVEAVHLCSTTPADQMGRRDLGRLEIGAAADLVVLDRSLGVRAAFVAGREWRNTSGGRNV
jgi:N-acetylglucosamine-6-phosphate deacetylase